MDPYLIIVFALLLLAGLDLVVGVSNDAVNFLNSAIGSKVAKRQVIFAIAAAGVFVGATFSTGMMEVARKGIFNPSFFTFEAIMVVFMAVMLTDILILDLFNSLGMPTSTTVSIVFELLGASVVTGLLMIANSPDSSLGLLDVINYEKALIIISGIFLSIIVAFSLGALVQWFSRFLFTFHFEKRLRKYGAPFAGFALSLIFYFLLIKGMKSATFVSDDFAGTVSDHVFKLLGITFLLTTLLTFLLQRLFKVNPLKVVVLSGTFALAMAFAGNDLVNFIGVPIAGYQSFNIWQASGLAADEFKMNALAAAVKTPSLILYGAGIIMVLTLWFSSKARRVTDTELKLGSQSAVDERFKPNKLSRGIVKAANKVGEWVKTNISRKTNVYINWRFRLLTIDQSDKPAFDLVRASVNLMVASILIAFASSLKLPLSTTYVSFMVAMGSSLADKAWGSGSATHRVAGVLNVIGGWFLTAAGAFTGAGLVALLIYYGGPWLAIGLFAIALVVLIRSNLPQALRRRQI